MSMINDQTSLYVIEEINCRGEVSKAKFKVTLLDIKMAQSYQSDDHNNDDEEIDSFLDNFDRNDSSLMCCIIFNDDDFVNKILENNGCTVVGEESIYGIGVTKELSYKYFCDFDNSVKDWD